MQPVPHPKIALAQPSNQSSGNPKSALVASHDASHAEPLLGDRRPRFRARQLQSDLSGILPATRSQRDPSPMPHNIQLRLRGSRSPDSFPFPAVRGRQRPSVFGPLGVSDQLVLREDAPLLVNRVVRLGSDDEWRGRNGLVNPKRLVLRAEESGLVLVCNVQAIDRGFASLIAERLEPDQPPLFTDCLNNNS